MLQGKQFQNHFSVGQFVTWHFMTQMIWNPFKIKQDQKIPTPWPLVAWEIFPQAVIPEASLMTGANT